MPGMHLSTLVRRMWRDAHSGDGTSDAELLARFARTRDASAFELLVWRHGALVLETCRRVLHHNEDAEDAFQAVFLILARKAGGISRGTALPAWLHRVAVRLSLRLTQSRRATVVLQADVVVDTSSDTAVNSETLRALDEEIDRLPERGRRAVVLCYLEGLTAAEAAQRLGCPTGTVESRLASARKRLRDRLTRRGFTLPATILASSALTADAVARVTRASVAFVRGEVETALTEQSQRLAKGVLTMWRTQTYFVLLAAAVTALAVVAGAAWANRDSDSPQQPEVKVQLPVRAESDPKANPWGGKPALVAATGGILYDISPDGTQFLFADGSKLVCFNRATNKTLWKIENEKLCESKFSPDSKTVAATDRKSVVLLDAATGKTLHALKVKEGEVRQVHYQPDGTLLYHTTWSTVGGSRPNAWKGTYNFSLVHYDPVAKKELGRISDSVTYNLDSSFATTYSRGVGSFTEVMVWSNKSGVERTTNYIDSITGKTVATIKLSDMDAVFDLSTDGKRALAREVGKSPRVIDTATGKTVVALNGHSQFFIAGVFSPDGKLIATVSGIPEYAKPAGDGTLLPPPLQSVRQPAELMVWDAKTGKLLSRTEFAPSKMEFNNVRFSPDSKFLVVMNQRDKSAYYAFGVVPFKHEGGANLDSSEPLQLIPGEPLKPESGGVVSDNLDRLIDELAKSEKSGAEKVDAIFLAVLGRFATASEQQRAKEKFGDKITTEQFRALLGELAATPEFDSYLKAIQKRRP